jgi:hypothetical protein
MPFSLQTPVYGAMGVACIVGFLFLYSLIFGSDCPEPTRFDSLVDEVASPAFGVVDERDMSYVDPAPATAPEQTPSLLPGGLEPEVPLEGLVGYDPGPHFGFGAFLRDASGGGSGTGEISTMR